MKELTVRQSKIYNALGVFLNRKKIINSHAITHLLIDKFAINKKESWQHIDFKELKELKILPNENHQTFNHWRLSMIKQEILICAANFEELKSERPNYKCNLFKPGKLIGKYIDKAEIEFLPQKVESIFDSLEKIDNKFDAIDNRFENIDDRIGDMQNEMKGLASIILTLCPPDTDERRKILKGNFTDIEKCLMLLRKEEDIN